MMRLLSRRLRAFFGLCEALAMTAWLVLCLMGSTSRYFDTPRTWRRRAKKSPTSTWRDFLKRLG